MFWPENPAVKTFGQISCLTIMTMILNSDSWRKSSCAQGGAVYKCSASRPGDCSIIPFDTKGSLCPPHMTSSPPAPPWSSPWSPWSDRCCPGPTMAPTGQQYDSKSGQWLGSTLDSSGEDGTILVRIEIIHSYSSHTKFIILRQRSWCTQIPGYKHHSLVISS